MPKARGKPERRLSKIGILESAKVVIKDDHAGD